MIIKKRLLLLAFFVSLFLIHVPIALILIFADFTHVDFDEIIAKNKAKDQNAAKVTMVKLNLPLVDMDKPQKQEKPDQYKAVSQYNVKTDNETVSSGKSASPSQSSQKAKTEPKKTQKKSAQKSSQIAQNNKQKTSQKKTASHSGKKKKSKPKQQDSKKTAAPNNLKNALAALDEQQKQKEAELQKLFESQSKQEFKTSFSRGGDYLPYYKIGNKTYVNAIAHPDVSYYAEMKRKFRYAWDPFPVLKGKSHLFSNGAIRVIWGITLDANGRVVQMTLIRASPNGAYDSEAKRTILASAPFSPPPKKILNENNLLHVAWGFTVYF